MKQKAGRNHVEYEISDSGGLLKLYYIPQTLVAIGQKMDDQMKVEVHHIGPPDGVMARIWLEGNWSEGFFLDRECIGGFDQGGPWVKENRNMGQLNEYLSLFGLRQNKDNYLGFDISIVEPVEPDRIQDCEE